MMESILGIGFDSRDDDSAAIIEKESTVEGSEGKDTENIKVQTQQRRNMWP